VTLTRSLVNELVYGTVVERLAGKTKHNLSTVERLRSHES